MKCEQIQLIINDYVDGTLPELQADTVKNHCVSCESCSASINALEKQKELLKSIAVPPASSGFEKRVIEAAVFNAQAEHSLSLKHDSIIKFAAAAMISALVVWLGLFSESNVSQNSETLIAVSDEVRTIKVAIDSEQALDDVSLRIELSDNLELAGFGNKKQINWTTGLRKGVNVIALPVVGIAKGKGDITTRIQLNGKEKVMRINTQYKLPDSVLYNTNAVLQS